MQDHKIIHSIERSVLSSIFFNEDKFDEIRDLLDSNDFNMDLHVEIFESCKKLRREQKPIDFEFVCLELKKTTKFTQDDVLGVISANPVTNIDTYIKEIKNASINRSLFSLASFIRDESLKEGADAEEILDIAQNKIYKIGASSFRQDFVGSREITIRTLDYIKYIKTCEDGIVGIDTGFHELNKVTTGFNKGELVVIGARPSMGKTALALSMVIKMLLRGNGVAIFSLEMPNEQLMLRMLSAMSLIPLQTLRNGMLNDNQLEVLSQKAQIMCEKDLFIDDCSILTISQLRTKLRKLKSSVPNVQIAIIDYLQLMVNSNRDTNRHEMISEISRGLKTLARELDMPIVALAQLNRAVELRDDKRPMLSDLRDSGAIEQDADIILFLYRDDVYKEREFYSKMAKREKDGKSKEKTDSFVRKDIEDAELIVAKNRNGEVKTVHTQFNKKYTLFQDKQDNLESEYNYSETEFEMPL